MLVKPIKPYHGVIYFSTAWRSSGINATVEFRDVPKINERDRESDVLNAFGRN